MFHFRPRSGLRLAAALLALVISAGALSGSSVVQPEISVESGEKAEEASAPALAYRHLKGTKYTNLISARYPNLLATLSPKSEPESEEGEPSASGSSGSSGGTYGSNSSTQTYSYSGTVSPSAYVTVSGTRLSSYPIFKNTQYYSFASSAYNYHELAWTSMNTRLSGGSVSNNVILYGHNWGNCFYPFNSGGAQFEALMDFFSNSFASSNRSITLTTADGYSYKYKVFAVFFTRNLNFYIYPNGGVANVAAQAIGLSQSYGLYNSSYEGGKLLTLSTCTRYLGNDAGQRFVVMAELVG